MSTQAASPVAAGQRCEHGTHEPRGYVACREPAVQRCTWAAPVFGAPGSAKPCGARYCAAHGQTVEGRGARCWRHTT